MIKSIAFTVYAVKNMKKSRAFYEGILGLRTGSEYNGAGEKNPAWIEYVIKGPGASEAVFAIGCSPDWKPSKDGASVAFEVDNFDKFITKLKAKKISFKLQPMYLTTCSMAVIEDPDKNKIIIHQKDGKVASLKK